jgi:hypothetical protein
MKSWLHNIAESYIQETPATRRDLKEHYSLLSEEEKFALLSENALKYLDEQLKVAYGFGIGDLTEEELNTVFSNLVQVKKPKAETKESKPRKYPVQLDKGVPQENAFFKSLSPEMQEKISPGKKSK